VPLNFGHGPESVDAKGKEPKLREDGASLTFKLNLQKI
jgi:hypothetical protein